MKRFLVACRRSTIVIVAVRRCSILATIDLDD
jgi:hypothetical protein